MSAWLRMMVASPSRSSGWSSTLRIRIRALSVVWVILLLRLPAFALSAAQDVSQYGHTAWSLQRGTFRGYPISITQTADGYLWIGTQFGIVRFDGARFVPWEPPPGTPLPSSVINQLLSARDGSLWIGTSQGLARWDGEELTVVRELAGQYVATLAEDRRGSIWAGTQVDPGSSARLCAIQHGQAKCDAASGKLGHFVSALYADRQDTLWVGAATGLWRWRPAPGHHLTVPDPLPEVRAILQDQRGDILVAANRDLMRVANQLIETYPIPRGEARMRPTALMLDRDGSLWIGTQDQGLVHMHEGKVDRFSRADGLSSDFVLGLFEDREGSIWAATLNGLDRFRETAVVAVSTKQGLRSNNVASVLEGSDGTVWIRTDRGLDRWNAGLITPVDSPDLSGDTGSSLFQDRSDRLWFPSSRGLSYLHHDRGISIKAQGLGFSAIAQQRSGDLWVSSENSGILRFRDLSVVQTIPWAALGGKTARTLAASRVDDGLWVGFREGGLAYVKDGQVQAAYSTAEGLGRGDVTSLLAEQDGSVWASTESGLSLVKNGRVVTLSSRNGLPCDATHWAIADDRRSLWLLMPCGLVRAERHEIEAWVHNPERVIAVTTYDDTDGVPSQITVTPYAPSVTKAADGRLWFATNSGARVVDPAHLPFNPVPPPVRVEQITGDGRVYIPSMTRELPRGVRDVRFDYTALSLVAGEEVRFRYKLEGRDDDWVDAGNRRQAFYTDLPPRRYRFRVIAANNDGVWNEQGDAWEFSLPPALYQTSQFRILLGLFGAGLLWAAYAARLRRITSQMNRLLEERLAERTRIAQDLHDTLLQGSISASMQLHVLSAEVADESLKRKLDHILLRFRQMIDEGRQTVHALRTASDAQDDLEEALARLGEDLKGDRDIDVQVTVIGRHRPLNPLVRDSCYRVAREALANAVRHAKATTIEVEIAYLSDELGIRVVDNGRGIDPSVAQTGRRGHWGIQGMRERAARLGGTIAFTPGDPAGTEVELRVPGSRAFDPGRTGPRQEVRLEAIGHPDSAVVTHASRSRWSPARLRRRWRLSTTRADRDTPSHD